MEQQPPEEYNEYLSIEGLVFVLIVTVVGLAIGLATHQWMWSFTLSGIYGIVYQVTRLYDRL